MEQYKSYRIIDEKARWVVVDKNGKIIDRNPNSETLKKLKRLPEKDGRTMYKGKYKHSTREELLDYPIQFYEENGKPPSQNDFKNNSKYPNYSNYRKRFGSWSNVLKLVGLDVDSLVKRGLLETNNQKGRYAEIKVINHFIQHPVDLAGEDYHSPCDGICPNGKIYDVKSSKLHNDKYYVFGTNNEYKEEIEIYYLLAFNSDWKN